MNKKNELSRISIDIPKIKHRRLKKLAAELGLSKRQIILSALESMDECLCSSHIPNEETIKAIQDAKEKKNLIKAKDAEDLFNKLGL